MFAVASLLIGGLALGVRAAEPIYIDVRTPAEYATGAVEGAVNIPHDEIAARIAAVARDKDADIRLYCKSGGRSGLAKKTLESMGYTAVTNAGGYDALKRELADGD